MKGADKNLNLCTESFLENSAIPIKDQFFHPIILLEHIKGGFSLSRFPDYSTEGWGRRRK